MDKQTHAWKERGLTAWYHLIPRGNVEGELISPATTKYLQIFTYSSRYFCPVLNKFGFSREIFLGPILTLEYSTYRLSRNFGKQLPLDIFIREFLKWATSKGFLVKCTPLTEKLSGYIRRGKFLLWAYNVNYYYYYYYYWYLALWPVWTETRVQSVDWYGSRYAASWASS